MERTSQIYTASGINIVAGIWLIISPFLLNYATTGARNNDIVLGAIIGIIALIRVLSPFRSAWLSILNLLLGLWLIASPFVLNFATNTAKVNDFVLGIIVTVFAIWSIAAGSSHHLHAHA